VFSGIPQPTKIEITANTWETSELRITQSRDLNRVMTAAQRSLNTSFTPRILVVSNDEMLLRTRKMILGAYFDTRGTRRLSEAKTLILRSDFDLIVLCHSLPNVECGLLANQVRILSPSTVVLAMSSPDNDGPKPWADIQLDADMGPYGLLNACPSMLGFTLTSKVESSGASIG
jgi:hypothetical protein